MDAFRRRVNKLRSFDNNYVVIEGYTSMASLQHSRGLFSDLIIFTS
jgi:hypothetical protein